MDLKEVMNKKSFVIVGDTLSEEKFAYKIKHRMIENGYEVYCVGKELTSINQVPIDIDIIDLCINPVKGLIFMLECTKPFQCVVIQPGAQGDELKSYLSEKNIPYIENCLLIGLDKYKSQLCPLQ